MKRLLIILTALPLIAAGCQKDPYAHASYSPEPAHVGQEISFKNLSTNTDYTEWDMGDGFTSTAYNVKHFYVDPGFYTVKQSSFTQKGRVSVASYMVEVWGAELKVIVQLWTPDNEPPGYFVPGASVILYPTLTDWENETNPVVQYINGTAVTELFTNTVGECIFADLSNKRYYVDVWEQNHDNLTLASEDVEWIETQILEPAIYDETFIAYVDYYASAKKSTSRSDRPFKMIEESKSSVDRELKINKISKPRK